MQEWQPIDKAPRDGRMLLLHEGSSYDPTNPEEAGGYAHAVYVGWWGDLGLYDPCGVEDWIDWHGSSCCDDDFARWKRVGKVTHWMPLPEPPSFAEGV